MHIKELTNKIIQFRDARDWEQFHNSKDVALSLVLEASELLEHFQWKNHKEIEKYINTHKSDLGDELADILYWVLLMSHPLERKTQPRRSARQLGQRGLEGEPQLCGGVEPPRNPRGHGIPADRPFPGSP